MEGKVSVCTSAQVQLDEVCRRVQEDQSGQEVPLTLAFITDLHWERNSRRSPALLERLAQRLRLSALLFGGDYIVCEKEYGLTTRQELALMKECLDSFRVVTKVFCPLLGNHDRNSNGVENPDHFFTAEETTGVLFGTEQDNICFGGSFYYYCDLPRHHTRLICLDTGADKLGARLIAPEQLLWLRTALESMPREYHTVIGAHLLYEPEDWNRPLGRGSFTQAAEKILTVLDEFEAQCCENRVDCVLTGHLHSDLVLTTPGGIPILVTDADSGSALLRTPGVTPSPCFDIITIDRNHGTIFSRRVGRGTDRIVSIRQWEEEKR